jgi:hypothetical protein
MVPFVCVCVCGRFVVNLQVVFFDAAIWYSPGQKRAMVLMAIALGMLVFALDVIGRPNTEGLNNESCFFTCTSLHVSSMFSLVQSSLFLGKYLFKLIKSPTSLLILSVPMQYQGGDECTATVPGKTIAARTDATSHTNP